MDGPDATGLIFRVTGVLYRWQLNSIRLDEYVSPSGRFFMRMEFEGNFDGETLLGDLRTSLADCPEFSFSARAESQKSIIVLVTKGHHCLAELLI